MTGGGDTPVPTPLIGPIFAQNENQGSEFYRQYAAYGTRGDDIVMPVIEVPDPEDPTSPYYYFLNKATQDASTITVGEMYGSSDMDLNSLVIETFYSVTGNKVGLLVATFQTKPSDADIIAQLSAVFA